jgi:outer membrane protein assembly factor BamB
MRQRVHVWRAPLAVFALLTLSAAVRADDWPQWRGPSATGVTTEAGLPVRWGNDENVAWRARLPGLGVSSPIVHGDRVFVTSQVGSGVRRSGRHPAFVQGPDATASGERHLGGRAVGADGSMATTDSETVTFTVSAYRWSDGSRLWQQDLKAEGSLPAVHDKHNLATPSPATDGKIVIAWFGNGQVLAVDAATGKPRWTRHLGKEYAPFQIDWGHASSPILHDGLAIFLCYHEPGAYLLALDAATGAVKWKRDRPAGPRSYSTPLAVAHEGRSLLIVNSTHGIDAFDVSTGDPVWNIAEESRFGVPSPIHHGGIVYASRGYRSSPYLAIRLGGRGDVGNTHVVWRAPTGAPYVSSFVYHDGLLYMATELGIVSCLDASTGAVVWRDRLGGIFSASPVAGDGKIYLVSETGETIILKAGRTPEVIARNRLDAHLTASPAISRGRLFLRSDEELIAIGKATGS